MFDFFRPKTARDFMSDARENYGLPEVKQIPPMPATPPKDEDAKIFYRFGITDNNRVAFQMGYTEITMNKQGCQQLIDQVTFFMNQLDEEHVEEESNSNDPSAT